MTNFITKFITPEELPLVIEPDNKNIQLNEFHNLLRSKNDYFKKQLLKHGALLFRNFPVQNEHDFTSVIKHLNTGEFLNYIGGDSPRNKITEEVYTSTEAPPSMKLPLHNELSYVKNYPQHIFFYCHIAPEDHGQTIISDARTIYRAINDQVKQRFEEKGLRYISCYPLNSPIMNAINKHHKSWVNVFETHDKQEVERKCEENEIFYQWNHNDWLQISQVRPAAIEHPETHEKVWFNQAHHFDFNPKFLGWWRYIGTKLLYCRKHTLLHDVSFADHTSISRKDLYHIYDVLDQHTVYFPWKKGDVLVLDNVLCMHGRAPFTGKRRILTAMTGSGNPSSAH